MRKIVFALLLLSGLETFASEAKLLKRYPKLFHRDHGTLTIQIEKKSPLVFTNNSEKGGSFVKTTLEDYLPVTKLLLVHNNYQETGDYHLISLRSGDDIKLPTVPVWSSDRKYFAMANDDESESTENVFIIGRCNRKGCKTLLRREGRARGIRWKGSKQVSVNIRPFLNGSFGGAKKLTCKLNKDSSKCDD